MPQHGDRSGNDDAVDKLLRDGGVGFACRRGGRGGGQRSRSVHREHRHFAGGSVEEDDLRHQRGRVPLPADAAADAAARAGPGRLGFPADRAGVLASASSRSLLLAESLELGGGSRDLPLHLCVRRLERVELFQRLGVSLLLLRELFLHVREFCALRSELLLRRLHRRLHLALLLLLPNLCRRSLLVPELMRGERLALSRGEPAPVFGASQHDAGLVQRLLVVG
mmetsp:Transcript_7716/g.30489  ORF Transcript_7716/g.30489 Transcript_7716/m.30489 type:complete len:224 (-) Transcript_7716:616-1287(-)